jgi:hypothetical protein
VCQCAYTTAAIVYNIVLRVHAVAASLVVLLELFSAVHVLCTAADVFYNVILQSLLQLLSVDAAVQRVCTLLSVSSD